MRERRWGCRGGSPVCQLEDSYRVAVLPWVRTASQPLTVSDQL